MRTALILFDFDGTITRRDTLLAYILYSHGWLRTLLGFVLLSPYLAGWKLRFIHNQSAKEKVLQYFFGGERFESFNERCLAFSREELPRLVRRDAMSLIKQYQKEGARIVVVSASPENWVEPWCKAMRVECLATRLEARHGVLTGKINGQNCYGIEKATRIKAQIHLDHYAPIVAYGDSRGDKEMLALAHEPHYRALKN